MMNQEDQRNEGTYKEVSKLVKDVVALLNISTVKNRKRQKKNDLLFSESD